MIASPQPLQRPLGRPIRGVGGANIPAGRSFAGDMGDRSEGDSADSIERGEWVSHMRAKLPLEMAGSVGESGTCIGSWILGG